jgi:hypothetical protein
MTLIFAFLVLISYRTFQKSQDEVVNPYKVAFQASLVVFLLHLLDKYC